MRLFFALLPDMPTRERLVAAAAQLAFKGRARPVSQQNFHVTLAFIGDVPDPDLPLFREMGSMRLRHGAFDLDVLEFWPASQAIVLTARQNPREISVQTDQLRSSVAQWAHPKWTDGPWRAHVTLARKVVQAPVLTAISPITWVSQTYCLMSSMTGSDESVYTVVDSWPLLDKP